MLVGLTAHPVTIECHVGSGLPSTTIVGLPEGAVREARDRVRSAINNSGLEYPDGRIVFNLAPGHLAKTGSFLDLAMAISLLAATAQIRANRLSQFEFCGELSLFGELRKVTGAVAWALAARQAGRTLVVPRHNETEAALTPSGTTVVADSLLDTVALLNNNQPGQVPQPLPPRPAEKSEPLTRIVGQEGAKRALLIAAAGRHHILMVGPPGTGKTMLARAFNSLLPALSDQQMLEVAALYSAAGLTRDDYTSPPFRDPHHSASAQALVGGGRVPTPGEIALAHHGTLFLDELPHFKPAALNLLREPIETGFAVISRTHYKVQYPCRFQLVAAMNPCPAGRVCKVDACRCSTAQVQRYQARISGPMLDRVDLHVRVPELPAHLLTDMTDHSTQNTNDRSAAIVAGATQRQRARGQQANADLSLSQLKPQIASANVERSLLSAAVDQHQISARSYYKLWRVARTIADLQAVEEGMDETQALPISTRHFAEALSYRAMDWENHLHQGSG